MKKIIWYFLIISISIYAQTIDEAKKLFDDTQKYKEAIEIFHKYPNDGEAQYYLGKAYFYGIGVEKDEKKAFEYAKKSANQNNPSGLNLLGVVYQYGEGIEKDELQALMYYKQAANLGNTKAMRNLASMYANIGSSIIQINYDEAIEWLKKAVALNDVDSIIILANVLSSNEVQRDEESLKYYEMYINLKPKDIDFAYLKLAFAYKDLKNYELAYENLKKSAKLGNEDAILGIIYFDKKEIISDEELLYWMKKGVEKKIDLAYLPLAVYYRDKKDVENLKSFLHKAYYEDNNIESGCSLASYSSYESVLDDTNFPAIYNPKEALKIINDITSKYPFHEKISSCYTTLAYLYRQGNYVEKNHQKALEIYKQIKEKYSDSYLQSFTSEAINELENEFQEAKTIENSSNNTRISDENNLFTYIDNFSKVNQVATVLTSEDFYFISTSDKSIKVIDKKYLNLIKELSDKDIINVFDKKSLNTIKELRGYITNGADGIVTSMAYDEKNKLLYCAGINSTKNYILNDIIKIYDIGSGKIVKTIQNKKSFKNTFLNISKDGKYLVAINNNNRINFINTDTNEIQNFNLQDINDFVFATIEKTPSDYLIHLVSKDSHYYSISHTEGKIISQEPFRNQIDIKSKTYIDQAVGNEILNNFESFIPINKISYENSILQIGLENKGTFDFNDLKLKKSFYVAGEDEDNSTDISVDYKDGGATLEILKNKQKIGLINFGNMKAVYHKVIDNKYIFVVNSDYTTQCFFDLSGNPLLILDGMLFNQKNLIDTKKTLITYGDDNIIHIWDKEVLLKSKYNQEIYDSNVIKTLSYAFGGDPREMMHTNFSQEDLTNFEKSMRLDYQLDSEKLKAYLKLFMIQKDTINPLASLYIKNEKDWILYTPEGLFTYGGEGYKLLKYHQNQGLYKEAKIIENEKLFDKLYRPDLIKKILAGEKVDVPMDVKSVILNIKPPELQILSNQMINEKEIDLVYQVCDAGNGVADPKLVINGQAINPPSSRGFSIENIEAKDEKCKIYKSTHTLNSGENIISLKAYDKYKNIANQSEPIKVMANYKIEEKPNLYFLSIAVSDYKDDSLDLKYPVNDVKKVKEKLQQKSKLVYESIFTYELHDKDVTLENINKTFDEIKDKININDAFVLYVAGHGVSKDSIYHFIPYDQAEKISIHEIKTNLSKLENDKSLVLLDTCQSGAAIDSMVDEVTTVNRLSYDDNRNYIVASSKNQVALEGYKDHGVFTYGVLDAFINNDKLKVWGLADHISEIVPRITQEKFHFLQIPQAKLNQNFILTGEKK